MATPKPVSPVGLKVRRCEPELVAPSEPTPRELKPLSDVDDQMGLRFQVPNVQIYKSTPSMIGVDPVSLIRKSLAKALVYYYPFAGRIRSVLEPSGKLAVDCTGEGVLFVEADADVTLDWLGDFQAPLPCFEELLYDVPGSGEITDSPIMLIQVTRFLCGGFTLAFRHNHTMADAPGLVQFWNAVADVARGRPAPSVLPVWERHLLNARNPPRVTCTHVEFDQPPASSEPRQPEETMTQRAFFFGSSEVAAIRRTLLPRHLHSRSTFDVVAAYMWRSRVAALALEPSQVVHGVVNVNVRSKMVNAPIPKGYYGNAFAFAVARTTAGELAGKPLGHAVELVREAKERVTEEFMRSMVDLYVAVKGRARFTASVPYVMSDVRYAGFADVDFGWGKPVYGGVANSVGPEGGFIVRFKNSCGDNGITVAVTLPKQAMERFVETYEKLRFSANAFKSVDDYKTSIISSL